MFYFCDGLRYQPKKEIENFNNNALYALLRFFLFSNW